MLQLTVYSIVHSIVCTISTVLALFGSYEHIFTQKFFYTEQIF